MRTQCCQSFNISVYLFSYLKLILFVVLICSTVLSVKASHIKGGEITWQCLGASSGANAGKYVFQLKLYRDCGGVTLAPGGTEPIRVFGHPTITTINCNFISQTDLTPLGCGFTCATAPFGTPGFFEEFLFRSAPVILSGVPPPTGWVFYWDNICCRNAVDNLTGEVNMLIRSKMFSYNGQNANPCFDSSPFFAERPSSLLCIGYEFNYNNAAFDPNFDSLGYSWDFATDGVGWANAVELQFDTMFIGLDTLIFSLANPFPGNPELDSITGQLTVFPQTGIAPQGNFSTVIRIDSYRCNQKIAEVFREIQFSLTTGCVQTTTGINQPPIITPAPFQDSTGAFTSYDTTVFVGDTVSFIASISELDINLNLTNQVGSLEGIGAEFAANYSNTPPDNCSRPPCAYFTEATVPFQILPPPILTTPLPIKQFRFFWSTSCSHLLTDSSCNSGNATYHFILRLKDDACPNPAYNSRTVSITVKGPLITVDGDTLRTNFPNGTLQWYLNGNALSGETGSALVNAGFGNYTVVATLPGSGCQVSSPGVMAGTVAVDELKMQGMELYIYPNPANDQISIEFNSMKKTNADFVISDLSARTILQKDVSLLVGNNKLKMDLSGLQKGLYIIKLRNSEMEITKKLVLD